MTPDDAALLLGVRPGSSHVEVERAYRRLARTTHPDGGGADDAFIRLTQARDTLLAQPAPAVAAEPAVPRVVVPRPPSRLLFGTWIALLAVAIALSASAAPQPFTLAEPVVRYLLLATGLIGYAVTGRRGYLVLGCIALAATALVALLFTTLGALTGLLLLIAPTYGLLLIGQRRARYAAAA